MLKTLLRTGAAVALALTPALAQAQPAAQAQDQAQAQAAKDADPALWVVKDDDTTIYLFGTVHVLKPGLSWFDEAVKTAFDSSGEVVLEMIPPSEAEAARIVMSKGMSTSGPVTQKLPQEKRAAYASALADVGIPAAALDAYDPWLVTLTLAMAPLPKLGYDPKSGAESVISDAAKAAKKPVIGLETVEQQLDFFDTMPEPLQIRYLVSAIDEFPEIGPTLDRMVAAWSAGDPERLATIMNDSMRETPEVAKLLLTDRNARWAEWIDTRMDKPGTVFIAVGAGHLAGADSVQAFLAKRDLKATRVAY